VIGLNKTIIVGHRGTPLLAKENTLASFTKAIEIGADMIEFDVRKTKDGIMMVHHNPSIAGHPIHQLTYQEANQLVSSQGFVIPTVEEVLKLTQGKIKLDIEVKEVGYEREVLDLVLKYSKKDDFLMTSFHDQSLGVIKQHFPEIKVGLLLGGRPRLMQLFYHSDLFPEKRYQKIKADFLIAHYQLLKSGFLERAVHNKIGVYVWTVDNPILLTKLLNDNRVGAVITNKPDLAITLA
jgi:glycerophosphoryl diester phosphodiesterase